MLVFVLLYLAFSVVATMAFMFGSGLGYRRGLETATAHMAEGPGLRVAASPDAIREGRLPEDAHSGA